SVCMARLWPSSRKLRRDCRPDYCRRSIGILQVRSNRQFPVRIAVTRDWRAKKRHALRIPKDVPQRVVEAIANGALVARFERRELLQGGTKRVACGGRHPVQVDQRRLTLTALPEPQLLQFGAETGFFRDLPTGNVGPLYVEEVEREGLH